MFCGKIPLPILPMIPPPVLQAVGLYNPPLADCRHHLLSKKLSGINGGEKQVVG